MNIEDLRNGSVDQMQQTGFEGIDPNLEKNPPKKSKMREIDPVKELGLKSQKELDREDENLRVPEDKIFDDLDKAVERKTAEFQEFSDMYDQSEGDVTYEDMVEMDDGFDPIAMLANPPKPGHVTVSLDQKREILRGRGMSEEEIDQILGIRKPTAMTRPDNKKVVAKNQEPIKYENDEVDEDDLIEKEIMDGIPEEEPVIPDDTIVVVAPAKLENRVVSISKEEYNNPVDNSPAIPKAPEKNLSDTRSEDDDLKALDDEFSDSDTEQDEITKQRLELLKVGINEKLKPVENNFNITGFAISEKPVSLNAILGKKSPEPMKTGDWVLPCSDRSITMRSFTGPELDVLTSDRRNRSTIQTVREVYGMLYNHIIDPYKPADLDAWAKTVAITDVDHLYACAYRATFEGVNFLPYDCANPRCNNSFVTDSIPFMEMVKFKNEKAKKKFNTLIGQPSTPDNNKFKLNIVPISDVFALGLSIPSLYNVAFINASLDDEFKDKYQDVLNISPYVEYIYWINTESNTLQKINIKTYHGNEVKSMKAKVITLSKIIKELNSDQYNALRVTVNSMTEDGDDITYRMPAVTCEKCKQEIEETELTASQLLFLRHHLASLVNG